MKHLFFPFLLFLAYASHAQTTWTGTTGDWDDVANWDNGVPTSADDAIIPAGAIVTIPNMVMALAKSLLLGGSLMVDAGGSLGIDGGASASLGLLIEGTGSLASNGTFVVENIAGTAILIDNGSLTIEAAGTLSISNITSTGNGIENDGSVTNYNAMVLDNISGSGLKNNAGKTFTNSGNMASLNISNTSQPGLVNEGTFDNLGGTVNIGTGSSNTGVLNNSSPASFSVLGVFTNDNGAVINASLGSILSVDPN